jgi:hypothetical protein
MGVVVSARIQHGCPRGVLFKPLRQIIESVKDTFKGQLDLEQHGGHTPGGVIVRVLQRILALTTVIWHNDTTGQPTLRSLVAYDSHEVVKLILSGGCHGWGCLLVAALVAEQRPQHVDAAARQSPSCAAS